MTWGARKTKLAFSVPHPIHIHFCGYCYVLALPGDSEKSHLLSGRRNQRNLYQINSSAMWLTYPRGMFPLIWKSHRFVMWCVRNTFCSKKLFHAHWDGEDFVALQIWTSWRLTSRSSKKRPRHFRSSHFQFLLTFSGKVLLLAVVASADCKLAHRITILFSETKLHIDALTLVGCAGSPWLQVAFFRPRVDDLDCSSYIYSNFRRMQFQVAQLRTWAIKKIRITNCFR
jgi:hypothetical protein